MHFATAQARLASTAVRNGQTTTLAISGRGVRGACTACEAEAACTHSAGNLP
jgi:hypothetical protein